MSTAGDKQLFRNKIEDLAYRSVEYRTRGKGEPIDEDQFFDAVMECVDSFGGHVLIERGGFIAQLVQHNYNDYAATSQALIDSLTAQVAELKAEQEIVRERLDLLFRGPYMPQTNSIFHAFIVTRADIKAYIEAHKTAEE